MKEGVGGEKEQVGAVGPRHGVEDQLPCRLRHLGSIFGLQPPPLCMRLQGQSKEREREHSESRDKKLNNNSVFTGIHVDKLTANISKNIFF